MLRAGRDFFRIGRIVGCSFFEGFAPLGIVMLDVGRSGRAAGVVVFGGTARGTITTADHIFARSSARRTWGCRCFPAIRDSRTVMYTTDRGKLPSSAVDSTFGAVWP